MTSTKCGDSNKTSQVPPRASHIPTAKNVDFRDTYFFRNESSGLGLPSPDQVRQEARFRDRYQRPSISKPVHFPSLGLIVKFGADVTLAEGQCLWAIRRVLGGKVPVPEIYGWRHDHGEVFLYMQWIEGDTLEERWERLNNGQRKGVAEQLKGIITQLRTLQQDASEKCVGGIDGEPVRDIIFEPFPRSTQAYPTVCAFQDWFTGLANRHHPNPEKYVDPMRQGLPNDAPITFTHGDLHPTNIIVSRSNEETESKPDVLAIVDWHQSGWYPSYWDYCKAIYTVDPHSEWAREYIPMFLEPSDGYSAVNLYSRCSPIRLQSSGFFIRHCQAATMCSINNDPESPHEFDTLELRPQFWDTESICFEHPPPAMVRKTYLATYPTVATRFNAGRSHWGIFIPNADGDALGTMIHVTGTPFTGYGLEFKRNYDIERTNRHTRLFHIADVQDEHLDDTKIPPSVSAETTTSSEPTGFTIDINPRNAIEREAKKIDPPGPSSEPLNPAVGKRCQEWVRDYASWLIQRGIFPGNANTILDEAKAALGEKKRGN